jgi:hypothetical protein
VIDKPTNPNTAANINGLADFTAPSLSEIECHLKLEFPVNRGFEDDSKSADESRVGSTPTPGTSSEFAVLFDPKRLPKYAGEHGNRDREEVAITADAP